LAANAVLSAAPAGLRVAKIVDSLKNSLFAGNLPGDRFGHSRYVMLVKVANKDAESVVSALIKQSQRLPSELYRLLTWDRGKELADHQRLTLATEVEVYFCDPRSPWQRGSNENTNRLLRQYLPRGTDLSLHSQAKLSAIARQLKERPRKTLLYQTPAEKFAECVAAIG